jgi:hypothetical protein
MMTVFFCASNPAPSQWWSWNDHLFSYAFFLFAFRDATGALIGKVSDQANSWQLMNCCMQILFPTQQALKYRLPLPKQLGRGESYDEPAATSKAKPHFFHVPWPLANDWKVATLS